MFTPPEPAVARTPVMIRMPDELRNSVIDIATEQGLSMNTTIVQMLSYCLAVLAKSEKKAEKK